MSQRNLLVESSGCESRPVKASQQTGSQCCHSPGDRWVRSVHSKEAGREDSAPKSNRGGRRRRYASGRLYPDGR